MCLFVCLTRKPMKLTSSSITGGIQCAPYQNYTLDRASESSWTERRDGKPQQLLSANLQSRDPTLWKLNMAPSLGETGDTFRHFQSHLLQRDSSRTTKESPSLPVRTHRPHLWASQLLSPQSFIPCVTLCCCMCRIALLYLGQVAVVNEAYLVK